LFTEKQAHNTPSSNPNEPITKVFNYAYGGAGLSAQFIKVSLLVTNQILLLLLQTFLLLQSNNRSELIIGAPGVFDWKGKKKTNFYFTIKLNFFLF
jgi:hypothetical protein